MKGLQTEKKKKKTQLILFRYALDYTLLFFKKAHSKISMYLLFCSMFIDI